MHTHIYIHIYAHTRTQVVDMFGCGLPVLAVRYQCIDELVEENKNGLLFDDESSLAKKVFVTCMYVYVYM